MKTIAASHCGPSLAAFLYNYTALPVLGYRAQLLHTPDDMHIKERHALHHLFHMPPNSMDLTHFHQLELAGASAIKPVSSCCQAALYRTALVTISGWRAQLDCLERTFREHMSFAHWSSNVLAPPCWDTPPFVSNLAAALDGSSYRFRFLAPSRALPSLLSSWRPSLGQAARLPAQQIALRAFTSHILKNTWLDLICRRMPTLDPNEAFSPSPTCIENVCVCLSRCSKFVAMCWVKTISNAWTTTHRMHEVDRWACIFGCADCVDSLTHYVSCPLLLSLVHEICSTPFGPSVAHRLGLIDPSTSHLHMIAICFRVYHTLKGDFKSTIIEAFRCHRFANVHLQARKIASDCFHYFKNVFFPSANQEETTHSCSTVSSLRDGFTDGPVCKKPAVSPLPTNDAQHEIRISRRMPPHLTSSRSTLLDARSASLRADPRLSEVAPGVFSAVAAFGGGEHSRLDPALDV